MLAANLLFGRCQEDKVVTPTTARLLVRQHQEDMEQGDEGCSIVVGTQSIDTFLTTAIWQNYLLTTGTERIVLPGRNRLHRIYMRIQQERGTAGIVMRVDEPKVIARTMNLHSRAGHIRLKHIGHSLFFTADGRDGKHLFEQTDRLKIGCFEIHRIIF